MKKIVIGLCPTVVKLRCSPYDDKNYVFRVIKQHKVAVCSKLVEYYLEGVPDEYHDCINSFFDSIIGDDEQSYTIRIDSTQNIIEELIKQIRCIKHATFISDLEKNNKMFRGVEFLSPLSIVKEDKAYKDSYLFKCTVPLTNWFIPKDSPNAPIIEWFEDVFYGEETIVIHDQYVFNQNGLRAIDKHYAGIFPTKLKKLCFYGSLSASKQTKEGVIRHFSSSKYSGWVIQLFDCNEFHPRCIQVGELLISVDAGIDFLGKHDRTEKGCRISISYDDAESIEGANLFYEK